MAINQDGMKLWRMTPEGAQLENGNFELIADINQVADMWVWSLNLGWNKNIGQHMVYMHTGWDY